jgi:DNA-binding MarR family transcriptional regulator
VQRNQDLEELTDALLTASRVLVSIAARSIARHAGEVTLVQFRALVVLHSRGPQTVATLATELGVARSSASRLCDRLVAKGLIDRSPATEDRREVRLAITESGAAMVSAVTRHRRREIRRIVAGMDQGRGRELVTALQAFADSAGEVPDRQWFLGWA